MSFNTEKCQIVGFARQDCDNYSPEYFLNNIPLALVKSFKYLGVLISNNFSWDLHIETITARASQRLGMIKHVLFDAPKRVKRVAFLTLCRPLLEYAWEVWDPHLARRVSLLEGVQRTAIRFILGIKGRNSISKGRISLEMELLELRRRNTRMSLMLKFLSGSSHTSFIEGFIQMQNNVHSYQTRSVLGVLHWLCVQTLVFIYIVFYLEHCAIYAAYRKIQVFFMI